MAPAPPPAARRGKPPRVVISLMLGGLALLLALGAATSASLSGGSSLLSETAARTFRSVSHQPSPSAAARPPLAPPSSTAAPLPALSFRRRVEPFVVAVPASRRHLLAYPDDDDERDLHGGAGDASRAEAGAARGVAKHASGEGAASSATASRVRLAAFAAAPPRRRRQLLEQYEPRDDPNPHGGAGGAAAAAARTAERGVGTRASGEGAGDTSDSSVADTPQPTASATPGLAAPPSPEAAPLPPPPPPARCTFVTYIGGGAGTVELARDGEERVFVVREHTGSSNISISHAADDDPAAPLVVSYDEDSDSDEDESDCCVDYGGGDFANAMDKFCRVVDHAVAATDKATWLFRLWKFFGGGG